MQTKSVIFIGFLKYSVLVLYHFQCLGELISLPKKSTSSENERRSKCVHDQYMRNTCLACAVSRTCARTKINTKEDGINL